MHPPHPFRLLLGAELTAMKTKFTPGGALPSIPLSFSLATILPPEPKNFDFSQGAEQVIIEHCPIPSRHSLWLRLRRYLIVFDPLTFVLD